MLEAKLDLFNGQEVTLVRPLFGAQSDSWVGDLLYFDTTTYPIKFQVSAIGTATVFTAGDVKSTKLLSESSKDRPAPRLVITLKGPKDY